MASFDGPYHRAHADQEQEQSVPEPRPSKCPSKLTYQHLIFARKNFIMERDVQSEALVVETARESQFVSIDVDFNVADLENGSTADVIFIGTGQFHTVPTRFSIKVNTVSYEEKIFAVLTRYWKNYGSLS